MYSCFVEIENLVQPELSAHHEQAASLGCRLAEHIGLPVSKQRRILLAGLLYDIGLISTGERLEWVDDGLYNVNNHAFLGARLISELKFFKQVSKIIKYHHIPYRFGLGMDYLEEKVPLSSHILHLADRVCVQINKKRNITEQIPGIVSSIREQAKTVFMPELVDAFFDLSKKEGFWEDIVSPSPLYRSQILLFDTRDFSVEDLLDISKFISHIIDFRSSFTANHSAGVAKTAAVLASMAGLPESDYQLMLIAGYLHDIGKLAVDPALLNKPSALSPEEFETIKRHALITNKLLGKVKGFEKINTWASLHHEKLNGKGYPFGLKGRDIPLGARIMAVADVFTAVTEDRPYRKGMNKEAVIAVFESMVLDGSLCPNVVNLLMDNFELFNYVLANSQKKAEFEYRSFRSAMHQKF